MEPPLRQLKKKKVCLTYIPPSWNIKENFNVKYGSAILGKAYASHDRWIKH